MVSREESLSTLEEVARQEGLALYDVEFPKGGFGVLRVYLCTATGKAEGIDLQACARVARRITDHPEVESLVPGEATLEVSSPGVNRRLTRASHFEQAVGERVRVSFTRIQGGEQKKDTVKGVLCEVKDGILQVQCEGRKAEEGMEARGPRTESIELSEVREARVDFDFGKNAR